MQSLVQFKGFSAKLTKGQDHLLWLFVYAVSLVQSWAQTKMSRFCEKDKASSTKLCRENALLRKHRDQHIGQL